ncbi:MAG TPA: pantoate--beta-alanine ligase [Gemmatimonadales bacterium]|nr:pantoate--beta-alanine ligase [Gemmatimonadales bacterium]
MEQVTDISVLRSWVTSRRKAGQRIGLVPTMGALHAGHLSLVDEARRRSDAVAMSLFVNPLQFGPNEDFSRYPRDLARDHQLAAQRGVDLLFAPSVEAMYPQGAEIRVVPGETAARWEGEVRPGHFAGVLTIVAKLFHLVQPDVAVFGQKDIQQATLIRRMIRDLDFPIEMVVAPTVREADGLALSSRNAYLSPDQRSDARVLSAGLRAADAAWTRGETDSGRLLEIVRAEMARAPGVRPDYIAVVDPDHLVPVDIAAPGSIIVLAARVGTTRLLDNHILGSEIR